MIQIDEELWEMYHGSSVPKQLYIVFSNITLDNSKIFDFSMEESLSSDTDMLFGSCEATQFRARVEGVGKDIVGQKCKIHHVVDGKYTMPLGEYVIDSVSKKDDLGYREIIGYDEIYTKLAVDVTDWYKSLAFPMPLKTLRQSLFGYVGIPIREQELIQDNIEIERTIEPQSLNGRDVAQAIGELNGTFGHIGRDGKFKYIHLGSTGLYPAEDLYPSEELFPAEADSIFESSTVFSCTREEYEVAGIDCLQIRQQEGDVGAVVFDNRKYSNPYIVTGNFLVYGKSAKQLEEIARTLFNFIKGEKYTPYTAKVIGLPYLEVGDGITFTTKKDNFLSFIMKRKFSGIQSLRDEFSATGNQQRDNEVSPNMEIEMLKGRSTVIEKSVEGIKVTVADLEADTNSKFEQTANRITAEVASINKDMSSRFELTNNTITAEVKRATSAEGTLSSRITVTEQNIELKVDKNGIISAINISPENVRIQGKKIQLDGEVTFSNSNKFALGAATTIVDAGCISTGTLDASKANITNINASNITTGSFNANLITAGTLDANKITVRNLVVGENVTMGRNATISWSNVTGTGDVAYIDDIPTDTYITKITKDTITTKYIDSLGITAKYVRAEGISGGTIEGVTLYFSKRNGLFWTTADGSWICDSNAIYTSDRRVQVYANGDAHFEGTTYTDMVSANRGRFSDWCYSPDWTNGSDERIKNHINYNDNKRLAEIIDNVKPVSYYMNSDKKNKLRFGFIAQDVKATIDNLFNGEQAIYSYSEDEDIYSLSYNDLIAPVVAKIHFMQNEINELKTDLAKIKKG